MGAVTLPHRWSLINKLGMWNDEAARRSPVFPSKQWFSLC